MRELIEKLMAGGMGKFMGKLIPKLIGKLMEKLMAGHWKVRKLMVGGWESSLKTACP